MSDWHNRWMDTARLISSWSKDRSRKCGAVIVDGRQNQLSSGWNGFPRGIRDDVEARHERPAKYTWTEHAERNAIYNAAAAGTRLLGATMYVTWFPCSDCARAIIQSGIKRLVCIKFDVADPKWGADFLVAKEMLEEAEIFVQFIEGEPPQQQ